MGLIELAIPFFFLLIGVELLANKLLHRHDYRLNDSVNDLSMGIVDQIGGAFLNTLYFIGYLYVWEYWRLFDMGGDPLADYEGIAPWLKGTVGIPLWVWVACFLCKDMMYYWAHRMSHEMNLGWATHIAHHQSEEFNLAVALRQGVFQGFFFNIFYLPLALIGFPPAVYITCSAINTLYQFWIHTRSIGKLGPLEWVLNTPSHHRVHHGRDPKYIDRNHAGTLIIWDRMFGTFQEEEEEPNYGIVTPLKSWNPVWGQVHYLVKLAQTAWRAPRWTDKVRLWFKPPAWAPEGLPVPQSVPETRRAGYQKYDARVRGPLAAYVLVQFAVAVVLTTGFLNAQRDMALAHKLSAAVLLTLTLVSYGAIFERKPWALPLEVGRVAATATAIAVWGGGFFGFASFQGPAAVATALVGGAGSLAWFLACHAQLRRGAEEREGSPGIRGSVEA